MLGFSIVSLVTGFLLPYFGIRGDSLERPWHWRRWFTLPSLWAISCWFFAINMAFTASVHSVGPAILIMSLAGFPWAAINWIPFTLLGEMVTIYSENPELQNGQRDYLPISDADNASTSYQTTLAEENNMPLNAGIILGIQNVYIVLPQFVSTVLCSGVFMAYGDGDADAFGVCLRLGALFSILAGILSFRVPEMVPKRQS
jgi:hypothetical protein